MQKIDYEQLKYSRQYILSNEEIVCSFRHNSIDLICNYKLLYHKNLVVTECSSTNIRLILIGDIYDYLNPEYGNEEILTNLTDMSFSKLVLATAKMAGRFVMIVIDQKSIKLFHDTSACRKVYYADRGGSAICSSSQHLLASALNIEPTKDQSKLSYYKSEDFKLNHFSNIVDSTYYDDICQLLPNHFLNVSSSDIKRFWPHEALPPLSKEDCVDECATMIEGFLIAASNRYQLMMPVSAGYDSRILLAASKEIHENVFYYLNNSNDVRQSADSWVPQKLLLKNNLKFNLLEISNHVDEKFQEVYYSNNLFANPEMIEIMQNYLLHYPDKLNLPGGTIPIIKSMYNSSTNKITGEVLAKLHGYNKYQFANIVYDKWFERLNGVCERTNTNIYDLLYWEDRTPNWGTEVQLDKEIAQEEFVVFNSAYLVSRMLTYDMAQRKQPHYKLHKDLIKALWPELLDLPFNPSLTNTIKQLLIKLHIYTPVIKIKKFLFK